MVPPMLSAVLHIERHALLVGRVGQQMHVQRLRRENLPSPTIQCEASSTADQLDNVHERLVAFVAAPCILNVRRSGLHSCKLD